MNSNSISWLVFSCKGGAAQQKIKLMESSGDKNFQSTSCTCCHNVKSFTFRSAALKTFTISPRPENHSFEVLVEEGLGYDNDSCFYMNPFRQTPEYKAYEQFSLVIGLLTLGFALHSHNKDTIFSVGYIAWLSQTLVSN